MVLSLKRLSCLLLLLLISGCQQDIELHKKLSEEDANEVIAELASRHIEAEKKATKEGVTVLVEASSMARAVRILEAAGLPRKPRANFGEVFKKEGVISSPLEERARYIYALSQELESTISQIDGILIARVHVVLPERIAPGEAVQPASSAVFIKHRPDLDPDVIRPRIERLVRTSIPGLSEKPDKLSVVFVVTKAYQEQQQLVRVGPFLMDASDLWVWRSAIIGVSILFVLLLFASAFAIKPDLKTMIFNRAPKLDKGAHDGTPP
ncbi:type III secretion system inner membrane ring lipoprotein SctJ [Marinomonas mediterranea]|jgi:type III secretion apparatus lipoprotein, YscJ/HrcJ family|uniref:Lipoprotein n=1 Tax=Marinomonas mediterranea (strain ATCC 700492 / JCM 21426 / NBRC 103028 / MMB-1) TaxID=717774 RepID=F2JTE4_MARM1|nr:type III secretion inner membrane ring lipoprotein SctJ [Marinomonas mediterranea]ADZ90362.1 type III secretion apparatus lipoprotein, YscJ/HrcJ family [Marinomonas mediterranea MMB-1]WCN16544.1 EscJ/YscJ/HrcJ family type III secretion inner membrane ring protein [Marinomonas mediterranea MMB-1]